MIFHIFILSLLKIKFKTFNTDIKMKDLLTLNNLKSINFMTEKFPLSDDTLAQAYNILYGEGYKPYLSNQTKASEIHSIFSSNVSPSLEFIKYVECIFFLEKELIKPENQLLSLKNSYNNQTIEVQVEVVNIDMKVLANSKEQVNVINVDTKEDGPNKYMLTLEVDRLGKGSETIIDIQDLSMSDFIAYCKKQYCIIK